MASNRLTSFAFWDSIHSRIERTRLPDGLRASERNVRRLLRRYIKPGSRVMEIGFAPGRTLLWTATALGASVSGVDFSPAGVAAARLIFDEHKIPCDMRCEDVDTHTFSKGTFDIVFSLGFVEHFQDVSSLIVRHAELARVGGTVIIVIPRYDGLYRRLQAALDPSNLALHNLSIMSEDALLRAASAVGVAAHAYRFGRVQPGLISWRHLGSVTGRVLYHVVNAAGLLQPFDVSPLCPLLVLELRR